MHIIDKLLISSLVVIVIIIVIAITVWIKCCGNKSKKNKKLDFEVERYRAKIQNSPNRYCNDFAVVPNSPNRCSNDFAVVPNSPIVNANVTRNFSYFDKPYISYTSVHKEISEQRTYRNSNLFKNDSNFKSYNLIKNVTNNPTSSDIYRKTNLLKIDIVKLSDWNDSDSFYYYHYTSLNNARQILRDRKLKANIPKVKHFGKGIFFTVLEPSSTDEQLIKNNYIYYSKAYLSNVECAFAFHENDLFLKKLRDKFSRDVWKCNDDIDLSQVNCKIIIRKTNYRFYYELNT